MNGSASGRNGDPLRGSAGHWVEINNRGIGKKMHRTKKGEAKNRNLYLSLVLILSLGLFSGCSSKLVVNKKLIDQFVPAVVLEKNESLVYVIRQSSMLGGARGLYVALNDQIIANIHSGKYCYFKVKDGINTINLEQIMPFHFYRLDNRPGETLYLYFEMTSGKFLELPEDLGITAVMKAKKAKDIGRPKNNKGYVSAIMNPGLLNLYLMKETAENIGPDKENAIITFIRPQSFVKEMAFGIWSENAFLGNLKGESYFQIKVPAGKHTFFGRSEQFSVLEAEVEAGKHYFVKVRATMGWAQAHIRLLPVKIDEKQSAIQKWLDNSKQVIIDDAAIDTQIKSRLNLALPYIERALNNVNSGEAESRYLNKTDGR